MSIGAISWRCTALLGIVASMGACNGTLDLGPAGPYTSAGPTQGVPSNCPPAPGTNSRTDQVRLGLEPTCIGCHRSGDSGYFASLNAFESLLVGDPRLVRPGDPEHSGLVMLLEGRRTGDSLTQMPISGDPFSVLSARGETRITIEEIRDWITHLEVPALSTEPNWTAPTSPRIRASQLELGLMELLGLSEEDFYGPASSHGVAELLPRNPDFFDLRSPDRVPAQWYSRRPYTALGGGSAIETQYEDRSISTSFIQTLVPLSQSWCGLAIAKPGNTALFDAATAMTGTAEPSVLREQLADWHLLFLARRATDEELDFIIESVFTPLEASADTRTAWVGTCSYFIRHPLFVFY